MIVADRTIRVFISSTFRDMQAERDHLVKFIFPQLRKLCEARGVIWGEVDLRWGVTDEQAAEGKVLPICLEEIKRCRPYFIGLLGERYGWIPDALPDDLLEREPWLKEHLHGKTSVTELEILHGVLRNPQMAGHAYFYFRDPKYIETVGDEEKKKFTAENGKDAEKLSGLKENIRHSGFPVRENYPGPKELGELVLADLTKVINENWPEGSQPDPLDREAMDHEAYAQSRERVYIGRQEYFDRLDTHAAASDSHPLVVLGESGSGKSALLANWVARYRQTHPDALVLQHYIGATPYSADWAAMLRRLMGEFKRRLGLQQDIPDQPDALRSAFPNWLYMAAAKGRVVLVLDALNQLEDRDGAHDLVWLPPVLPENVRLIVSTLPGRPLDEIQKRNWPTLKVELLDARERTKLLWKFLRQSGKRLNKKRRRRIAAAPPSANPLYLRVLLDELRLVRTHEELEERIGDYLKAESPYALYEKVIARWEQDYGQDEKGKPTKIVGDTLSLLWASRRGLTETELLQAMGKDGEPLPRAKWSPLFLAVSDALISRGGLLTFAHDFLRTAVENAYLPTEQNQRRAHLHLADYFERQPASPRRIDELPWQLAQAKEWQRLQMLLTDRFFFKEVWNKNQFEVKTYWTQIETGTNLRIVEAYRSQIQAPENEPDEDYLFYLRDLLRDTGTSGQEEAKKLGKKMIERDFGDPKDGIKKGADLVLKSMCGQLDSTGDPTFNRNFHNAAALMIYWNAHGYFEYAMLVAMELERISRQLGDFDKLQNILEWQGRILSGSHDFEGALARYKKQELVCRQSGNLNTLSSALILQAMILNDRGDLNGAMASYKESEQICQQLGNLHGLVITLNHQCDILEKRDDLVGAMALCKECERICRQVGMVKDLAASLMFRASLHHKIGNTLECLPLVEEAHRLFTSLGDTASVDKSELMLKLIRMAQSKGIGQSPVAVPASSLSALPIPPRELTISELRDSAAAALKRGLWEAAETCLEKLLQQGEPVETVAPDLITAVLNAHETISAHTVTRIETLLAQLSAAGHTALAQQLRPKFTAKLEASKPKKSKWKFW